MSADAATAASIIRAALDAAAVCGTLLSVFLMMEVRKLRMELEDASMLSSRLAAWCARLDKKRGSAKRKPTRPPVKNDAKDAKNDAEKDAQAPTTFDQAAAEAAAHVASFSAHKKRRKKDAKNDAKPENTGDVAPDENLTEKRRTDNVASFSASFSPSKKDAKSTQRSRRNSDAGKPTNIQSWDALYGTASDR